MKESKSKIIYTHYEFNFDLVIENDKTRALFLKHCKTELNYELFEFCTHVEKYSKNPTKSHAMDIYNTYVLEDSKQEINIPLALRRQVEFDIKNLPEAIDDQTFEAVKHVFDSCYGQVRMSLYNSFGRFKRSKDFINFVQKQSDVFLRSIAKHKSEIVSQVLQVENFVTPKILDSDLQFAQELAQDYYYWKPIYYNKQLRMTLYNGHGKHKFINAETEEKTGLMVAMKTEFYVQQHAYQTMLGLFSETYRSKALGLKNLSLLEYDTENKYPTSVFKGKLWVGNLFQLRDVVCAISALYEKSTKSYMVILRSCEHPKEGEISLRGHYFFIYRFSDLGPTETKIQMIVLANSHGAMEAQKPGMFYDFIVKLGAPELCKVQCKEILKMEKEDCAVYADDSNIAQMIKDQGIVL